MDCCFHPFWRWLESTVTGVELFVASSHTDYPCNPLLLSLYNFLTLMETQQS